MSMLCLLQIVDRISRFAAKMPSMLSCGIRMAGPMSRKTWSAPWWLRSVPGSVFLDLTEDVQEWPTTGICTGTDSLL